MSLQVYHIPYGVMNEATYSNHNFKGVFNFKAPHSV